MYVCKYTLSLGSTSDSICEPIHTCQYVCMSLYCGSPRDRVASVTEILLSLSSVRHVMVSINHNSQSGGIGESELLCSPDTRVKLSSGSRSPRVRTVSNSVFYGRMASMMGQCRRECLHDGRGGGDLCHRVRRQPTAAVNNWHRLI